ncbi:MAG: GNAT family N-acetyltransferase [Chitinophagia bacterium]|nr:GNAT family N-acetyltransferase [Chitinophagia bacterium]
MSSSLTIRTARREDCPRLLQLIQELADYEKAPHQVTVSAAHFEESGFGKTPVWWAFVAEDENDIQGFRYSTWKGQCLYLEDIIVTASQRGKGIGAALFETILQEAKEKKMARVCWQVLDWNEPAINFYKKYQAAFDAQWLNGAIEIQLDR